MDNNHSTRRCVRCNQVKDISAYALDYGRKSRRQCMQCKKERDREYHQGPRGRASVAWRNIVSRAGIHPDYANVEVRVTRDEFMSWAVPLFEAWDSSEKPSIDRIDFRGHYEFSNLQVVSWNENRIKDRVNIRGPEGMQWCPDCQSYLSSESFYSNKAARTGRCSYCKRHWRIRSNRMRRQRTSV